MARQLLLTFSLATLCIACGSQTATSAPQSSVPEHASDSARQVVGERPIPTSDAQWRQELSDERYAVLREAATERPYSSPLHVEERDGVYHCGGCGAALFASDQKFDAGCGWPSYMRPLNDDVIRLLPDESHGMHRTEVRCARCDSHLGHVFGDGPLPTHERYCINGAALDFEASGD